jgi:hypothetical protein
MSGKQQTEAFVVQFRAGTDVAGDRCDGRLEHVGSGRVTRFQSVEELAALLRRWLIDLRAEAAKTDPPVAFVERDAKQGQPLKN